MHFIEKLVKNKRKLNTCIVAKPHVVWVRRWYRWIVRWRVPKRCQ